MTIQNPANSATNGDAWEDDCAEGARYALLQRLAPALQHQMMGQFQSIGMIAGMMDRRLQSAAPDLASIRKDCASLDSVSQTAVNSMINMMTWVEPKSAAILKFDAGMKECVGLLATQFRFNGFAIVNEVPQIDLQVSSRAFRSVLSATLVALCDLSQAPADIVIQAQAMPDSVEVSIALRAATDRSAKNIQSIEYRLLNWRDVETLARAETVKLVHDQLGAQLIFSRAYEDSELYLPDERDSNASS